MLTQTLINEAYTVILWLAVWAAIAAAVLKGHHH